jgi:hypothetical protein
MNASIFRDIVPCNPLCEMACRRNISPPSSGIEIAEEEPALYRAVGHDSRTVRRQIVGSFVNHEL